MLCDVYPSVPTPVRRKRALSTAFIYLRALRSSKCPVLIESALRRMPHSCTCRLRIHAKYFQDGAEAGYCPRTLAAKEARADGTVAHSHFCGWFSIYCSRFIQHREEQVIGHKGF
ncbi:hypothetical protein NDU88_003139 [Pleurodeles waltl]|uniref:Uncharacterized protein n=1 Tax=Pleurodeles waltl TaxID=8319 RepID=A0AAV7WRX8_PLEWA|nr:hypothetical protein NDU88_003139 [Pleurodeles waltl]